MKKLMFSKVMVGCCLSSVIMELQMAQQPHTANLVTFLQFLSISTYGFIFTAKFGTVKPKIPLKQYTLLVALFFVTSVANNYVYMLHVPSTLHMIIRSASLPASVIVSWYAKSKGPEAHKCVGSVVVSLGVCAATYGGASLAKQDTGIFVHWCIGVFILLSTLFLGALTGLQQEKLFSKYGSHNEEMLFYTNILPLPLFLGLYPSLMSSAKDVTALGLVILSGNIVSQFVCANSVYELATKETSVTVTLVLTLRKFASLIISAIIFQSNLTCLHFVGTILVMFGTFVYFDYFNIALKAKNT